MFSFSYQRLCHPFLFMLFSAAPALFIQYMRTRIAGVSTESLPFAAS